MENLEEVIEELRKLGSKKVFVQYAEGLTTKILDIAKTIESKGFETVLCIEPAYGACDIRDEEAKRIGCDTILHIGHTPFGVNSSLPVVYWEYFIDSDPLPLIGANMNVFKGFKSLGIVCSLQYCKTIEKIRKFFETKGYRVYVGRGEKYPGQILGCRHYAAKSIESEVDAFVVISAGKFHALGLAFAVEKPVILVDLEAWKVINMDSEKKKIKKIIEWNKSMVKEAKRIGILVSWKKGQLKKPFELKKRLEANGKEVFILAFDTLNPQKIEGLKLDILVNTACPRIGIDDLDRYRIPIINVEYL